MKLWALVRKDETLNYRIGMGYDFHSFQEGGKLILGGVEIPSERGLKGHSDADVVLHALADALLEQPDSKTSEAISRKVIRATGASRAF